MIYGKVSCEWVTRLEQRALKFNLNTKEGSLDF